MACSVKKITESVVSEDKAQTERYVRNILKATEEERISASNTPLSFLVEIIKRVEPTLEGKAVTVLDLSRDSEGNFTMRYKLEQSDTILEMEIEDFSSFATKSDNFQLDKKTLTSFYSDFDTLNNFDDFEVLALDITNNPSKILEVAQSLIDADRYHNDDVHNQLLFEQLGRITEVLVETVPNLNVNINEAGEANFGEIDVDANEIYISSGVGGSKSLMEIYTHELYHAVTHYGLSNPTTAIRGISAKIEKIRDNFLANTTEADLVKMSGGTLNLKQAGKLLDHMTDPSVGLHEFVALSMTNKAIMNQLKTLDITSKKEVENPTLFYRLVDAVISLFNFVVQKVTKEPKGDDLARMVLLVTKLHNAHKKPLKAKRLLGIRSLIGIFDPIDKKWESFWEEKERKAKEDFKTIAQKEGEWKVTYMARLTARAFYDQKARDIIGNTVTTFPFLKPEDTIRTILRDMMAGDDLENKIGNLGLQSGVVDQQREHIAIQIASSILNGFNKVLSEAEESVLTDLVLDTDLSSIYFAYDIDLLLEDDKNIDDSINKIIEKLRSLSDEKSVNFYVAQSLLLADYMTTGKDNIALLKNARNIAQKLGTDMKEMEVSEELVSLIDEMTTLRALKQVSGEKKSAFKALLEEERSGVDNVVAFQFGNKDFSEKTLFPTPADKINIIKGYSSEITDPNIEVTTAPLSKRKELEGQGYVLKSTQVKHELDGSTTETGLFINNRFMMQSFQRVGLRITDKARRGTSVSQIYAMSGEDNITLRAVNDIKKMIARRNEVIKLMAEGKYDAKEKQSDNLVSPLLNNTGAVKDFTYGMDKEVKIELLDMERKVSTILGRTAATVYDKKETEVFNQKIMDLIIEDAALNVKGNRRTGLRNNKEYIVIEKDSSNERVRDFWSVLPSNIQAKYRKEGFPVRRDLMQAYLGYREMDILEATGVNRLMSTDPKELQRLVTYALRFAETLWQELIKISKIDIIIRTPGVFFGNVISNFVLLYVSDYSFKEITELKLQGVKELNQYVNGLKESITLEGKKRAGVISKEEVRRLNTINNNLKNSPVKDLVDEGFYTTIIEEVEHGNESGSYFNRLAKKKLKSMPKIFSDGVDLLYITENTKLFKLVEKSIQASDFAARYAQYHLLVEKGTSKEKAVKIVKENFIDYNKPNSRYLEWANKNGLVMFTKYFTRIQRVIGRYGKTDPSKVLLSILAQDYVLGEIDTIDDQSILVKDMGNLFYNPVDNMMRVFTPSSLEAIDWVLNGKD